MIIDFEINKNESDKTYQAIILSDGEKINEFKGFIYESTATSYVLGFIQGLRFEKGDLNENI